LVATPAQVDMWAGLDVGKGEHFADVLDNDGERLFAQAFASDQAGLEALLERAARYGTPGLVSTSPVRSPSLPSRSPPTAARRSPTCQAW